VGDHNSVALLHDVRRLVVFIFAVFDIEHGSMTAKQHSTSCAVLRYCMMYYINKNMVKS